MTGPGDSTRRGGVGSRVGSVEVTRLDDGSVALRDLKTNGAPAVVFTAPEWADFVRGSRAGQFDFGPAAGSRPAAADVESTVRLKL